MVTQHPVTLATRRDAQAIALMSRDLVEHGLGWSWTPARVAHAMKKPETNVAVVRRGARVLGFGIMEYGWRNAHLVLFAVDPVVRRQGVGHSVLNFLEMCAQVAGLEAVQLETRVSNASGRRFYLAHGYRETGTVPGYYSGREAAVRMAHSLGVPLPAG